MTDYIRKYSEIISKFLKDYSWNDILQLSNEYPDTRSLLINFRNVEQFNRELSKDLLSHPLELLPAFEEALREIDLPVDKTLDRAKVRIFNVPERVSIRDLRSQHLGKLLSIEGMVRKATETRPRVTRAAFQCMRCGHVTFVDQPGHKFEEPFAGCESELCGKKGPFKILIEESSFVDGQKLQIQEPPESLRGAQAQSLDIDLEDELTGTIAPGDRIIITGVLRSVQKSTREGKTTFYDIYLEGNSVEKLNSEFDELDISSQDEADILELSKDPEIYKKIIGTIAPVLYGYEDEKEALALQLFSGVAKEEDDGTRLRGDIHIGLFGDPGLGKSTLMDAVYMLSPRAVRSSGRGASASGLTATVSKDESAFGGGRWVVDAGALVMADMGLAVVDEMDKMDVNARSSLHEAMEGKQEINVTKAGIITTLKSRCALLGAANPKYGKFDQYEPIAEQINMPPSLLSRFDLIFVLLDKPGREMDSRISKHMLSTHMVGERRNNLLFHEGEFSTGASASHISPAIDAELFRKYVAYSRKNIFPILTDEAAACLDKYYVDVREASVGKKSVPITPRQLEAMVRISEASARARLCETVTEEDARRAIKLMRICLSAVGVNPETGEGDMGVLYGGTSADQRDRIRILKDLIPAKGSISIEDLQARARAQGISPEDVETHLQKMSSRGDLFRPDQDHITLVR